VISLSNRLNEIVDEANRHHSGITSHITWNKAVYAIEALSEEANSKIIMPNWTDSERSQLQTLKREETFNQAMKDLLDRGSAIGQKFNGVLLIYAMTYRGEKLWIIKHRKMKKHYGNLLREN
jgi:uncharacterized DUF497 family protein